MVFGVVIEIIAAWHGFVSKCIGLNVNGNDTTGKLEGASGRHAFLPFQAKGFWRFHFVFWGLYAFAHFGLLCLVWDDLWVVFGLTCTVVPSFFLISVMMREIYRRLGFRSVFGWQMLIGVFVVSAIGGWVQMMFSGVALEVINWLGIATDEAPHKVIRLIYQTTVLYAWSFAFLCSKAEVETRAEAEVETLAEIERRLEAMAAAERAELQMLRFQLNPHFLFNSLNTVITEIRERPEVALEVTHRLADYLRHTLENRGEMIVPLSHEISGSRQYLAIEKDRFGDDLTVEFDIQNDASEILIPAFLLQPLIENAMKHGMATSDPPWACSVSAGGTQDNLTILVSGTATLQPDATKENGQGHGLDILRRRLVLHYPDRATFDLVQEGEMVVAKLELEGEPCSG